MTSKATHSLALSALCTLLTACEQRASQPATPDTSPPFTAWRPDLGGAPAKDLFAASAPAPGPAPTYRVVISARGVSLRVGDEPGVELMPALGEQRFGPARLVRHEHGGWEIEATTQDGALRWRARAGAGAHELLTTLEPLTSAPLPVQTFSSSMPLEAPKAGATQEATRGASARWTRAGWVVEATPRGDQDLRAGPEGLVLDPSACEAASSPRAQSARTSPGSQAGS